MKLTAHQTRVIAALLALERKHAHAYWTRWDIGRVVGTGLSAGAIQLRTIAILKDAGLVHTEMSQMPADIRQHVNCNCACSHWGLTEPGRRAAEARADWQQKLGGGPARLITALNAALLSRLDLAAVVEMEASGGTFQKYLSMLRTNQLIEEGSGGRLQLVESLRG